LFLQSRESFLAGLELYCARTLRIVRPATGNDVSDREPGGRLYAEDNSKGVPPDTVDKLRKMFAFLDNMQGAGELSALTNWKVHTLAGDRKGTWSLSVTRNRRLTFYIDADDHQICDVNLEDYH